MMNLGPISDWMVLVADDEPDSIELITEVMEYQGASVRSATNGREALALLEHFKPTMILTDLSMPEVDGWAVLARVRKNPEFADIPVIALTAHAMTGDVERGLAAGFTGYITKPISPLSLVNDVLAQVAAYSEALANAPAKSEPVKKQEAAA